MKTFTNNIITHIFSISLILQFSQSQWIQQNSTISIEGLESVSFVDSQNGWAAGWAGAIVHTTNGGQTWIKQVTNTISSFSCISFCDTKNGWAVGSFGTILHTEDGGNTWERVLHDTMPSINNIKVKCFTPDIAIILRDSSAIDYRTSTRIWKTTSRGYEWADISPGYNSLYEMFFTSSDNGWIGGRGFQILHTNNSGTSWQNYTRFDNNWDRITGIYFENDMKGWTTIEDTLYTTTNGGLSWSVHSVPKFRSVTDLNIQDSIGYVVESSSIKKTTDGGITWLSQKTTGVIHDVEMVTKDNLWAVGYPGVILHTTNGGLTSNANSSNKVIDNYRLNQNYPNPFNPTTNIDYKISKSGILKISVSDVLGREIQILKSDFVSEGDYTIQWQAHALTSGIYFIKMSINGFVNTKRAVLLK
jgi:photosystem II stability/assembly factor-like uncharacterized protein